MYAHCVRCSYSNQRAYKRPRRLIGSDRHALRVQRSRSQYDQWTSTGFAANMKMLFSRLKLYSLVPIVMQLTASQTITKFTHVHDKTLSFELTIVGVAAYNTPM